MAHRYNRAPLSTCRRVVLEALGHDLADAAGWDPESISGYLGSDEREYWKSDEHYLQTLARDVWWHYDQVGDPEDMPDFERTQRRINRAMREIVRCKQ